MTPAPLCSRRVLTVSAVIVAIAVSCLLFSAPSGRSETSERLRRGGLSLLSVGSGSRFTLGIARVGRQLDAGQKHFLFVDIGLEGQCSAAGQSRYQLV